MKAAIVRKGLMVLLLGVLLVSGGRAVYTALEYQEEVAIYEEAQQSFVTVVETEVPLAEAPLVEISEMDVPMTSLPETVISQEEEVEEAEEVVVIPWQDPTVPNISVNFAGLSGVNSDVMGWIHLPNTTISYPLLHGENNQEYISTAYDGRSSAAGSIFVDYRIEGNLTEENTIIYGHRMSNKTMFGVLLDYRSWDFANLHPYFFILTDEGYRRYEVCYVMDTTADSSVYDYDFSQEGSYEAHLEILRQSALYDLGVEVTVEDKIITMSTCTGTTQDARFVVVAKLDQTILKD